MPVRVRIDSRGGRWVCHIVPEWDALTLWLLLRQVVVLALLGLLGAVIVTGGNVSIGSLPRMYVTKDPFVYLVPPLMALLCVSQLYKFALWMRHGERVSIGRKFMRIRQPSLRKPELSITLSGIGELSLQEHHRGITILYPDTVLSGGRIQVWARAEWYSFGRGLTDEQAQDLLDTVLAEMRRRGWEAPDEDQEETEQPQG